MKPARLTKLPSVIDFKYMQTLLISLASDKDGLSIFVRNAAKARGLGEYEDLLSGVKFELFAYRRLDGEKLLHMASNPTLERIAPFIGELALSWRDVLGAILNYTIEFIFMSG